MTPFLPLASEGNFGSSGSSTAEMTALLLVTMTAMDLGGGYRDRSRGLQVQAPGFLLRQLGSNSPRNLRNTVPLNFG